MNKPIICLLGAVLSLPAVAQIQNPDLLPAYKPECKVQGVVKVTGSELKGQMVAWEDGFKKFHPDVVFANNFATSSEGSIAGLYLAGSDLAPAGDDAKITDVMPFYNSYHYLPTEISVATGGYELRGSLWAIQIVVNKDNPLTKLTMEQVADIFGSQRTGGWDGILYTAKYARGPESNIRKWGQLGLTGEWADKPIQTYGYSAPGFIIAFERKLFHWSDKWNENYKEYVEAKEVTPDADGNAVASERMFEELSKDKYGIAWGPILHTKSYPQLKQIDLAWKESGPYVPLTQDNVQNRTYPLIRDAYIYLNRDPNRPLDPKVREFVRYILSREGQAALLPLGFYYPLTMEMVEKEQKKLE
ncbi:MAG TPA: substrate-binding domain-containing protein [Acidobacteriaceae bacterium]|jgi:phosphate transport system substrate-binding protein